MRDRSDARALAASLVAWYRAHARRLPWRDDPTPYHVLLSELMLQQTRVDTVIPYFLRFVARWPTLADLAAADEADVLTEWAGLGYYSRARNLHKAAIAAASGIPTTVDGLRALPGVGPYTAGAIASIAFGVPAPLVDGNVERVLSRLDDRHEDPRGAGRAALWDRAAELVTEADPSALNQGLMELGATVCTPRAPACDRCPWAADCLGRARGTAADLPRKAPKKAPREQRAVAGLADTEGGVLLGRRVPGLFGGLWEPVGGDVGEGESPRTALERAFRDHASLDARVEAHLGTVTHTLTHRRYTIEVYAVTAPGEPRASGRYDAIARWTGDRIGLSTLARKVLALRTAPRQEALFAAEPR